MRFNVISEKMQEKILHAKFLNVNIIFVIQDTLRNVTTPVKYNCGSSTQHTDRGSITGIIVLSEPRPNPGGGCLRLISHECSWEGKESMSFILDTITRQIGLFNLFKATGLKKKENS